MVVPEELAHAGTGAPAIEGPFSPDWWQSRSSDELQAIVHRGVQGGEVFFAAAAEMERRAREANAVVRAEEAHVIEDGHRRQTLGWVGLAALAITLALIARLTGLW